MSRTTTKLVGQGALLAMILIMVLALLAGGTAAGPAGDTGYDSGAALPRATRPEASDVTIAANGEEGVTGHIFEDTNGNGVEDAGEPGLPNISVVIIDASGSLQTVVTDANGDYAAVVPPGATLADVDESTLPAGYVQTVGTDPSTVDVPEDAVVDIGTDGFYRPPANPAISIHKSGPTMAIDGEVVSYLFDVVNDTQTGDGTPITGVTVVDDVAGSVPYVSGDDGDDVLEVGETWSFAVDYQVQESDPNVLHNTATVTGYDWDSDPVTDSDSHHLQVARVDLAAPYDWRDPLCASWHLRYTLTFTNTGSITLTNVVLSDTIPIMSSFIAEESSEGAEFDGERNVTWAIPLVSPGEVVVHYLEIRVQSNVPDGMVISDTLRLFCDQFVTKVISETTTIEQCPPPTATPTPTRPSPTPPPATETPTATPTLPAGRRITLPILVRQLTR